MLEMITLHINIGSNTGNRRALIDLAVALIFKQWGEKNVQVSEPVESTPWGFDSANKFINVGVLVKLNNEAQLKSNDKATCEKYAHDVLLTLQNIEQQISTTPHRNADGSYCDREIDIDLIAVDFDNTSIILSSPLLTLPHPRMHLRDFVLAPMWQLAPTWQHPLLGLNIAEMRMKIAAD